MQFASGDCGADSSLEGLPDVKHEAAGFAELGQHGGAQESDQPGSGVDAQMESRDVGIAHKDLGISGDQVVVEFVQELMGTVAADGRDDCLHFRISKHFVEIDHPVLNRSRGMAAPLGGMPAEPHPKAEALQFCYTPLQPARHKVRHRR